MPEKKPQVVWATIYGNEEKEGVGCYYCLVEGIHAASKLVYYVNGTSLCFKHTKELHESSQNNSQRTSDV